MTTTKWIVALTLMLITETVFGSVSEKNNIVLTSEQGCQIHYITKKNVDGWFIEGKIPDCPQKWVNGYADITIFDAFRKPVEQIFGYFKDGFWVGSQPIPFSAKTMSKISENEYSLEVEVGRNEKYDIQYLGQLRTQKMADGSFGSFNACPISRILAVTENKNLFEDENIQSELLNEAIYYAKILCPNVHQIHFYSAAIHQPMDEDVFFFADIDWLKKQIQVRRLPSSAEKIAKANRMSRVRVESLGVPVVHVTPIRPVEIASKQDDLNEDINKEEVSNQEEKISENINENEVNLSEQIIEEKEDVSTAENESSLPIDLDSLSEDASKEQAIETQNNMEDSSEKEVVVLDAIPHLLTASRLLKKAVKGQAVVHVFRVDLSGQAWIDAPVPMKANGQLVQTGWNIVSGLFSSEPPTRTKSGGIPPLGTIVITDTIPCVTEGCFAEPTIRGTP